MGVLANIFLENLLKKQNYYQCPTTPDLWCHARRPVLFFLVVDDFGVEYVGKRHSLHLNSVLEEHYKVTENWKVNLYFGINLKWDYINRTFRITTKYYIANLRVKFDHPHPAKPQPSLHKHAPIVYGSKIHYAAGPNNSTPLNAAGILRFQAIVGALLFYARDIYNKIIVALSELGQQKASVTKATNDSINQLIDYLSTYPSNSITFFVIIMVLSAHSDAAYLNIIKARSRVGAHIMLSEDVPVPSYNVLVLTGAQIIKFVMTSAAESELSGLYIFDKEKVPLRQALVEMCWLQPRSPIQFDDYTAVGVANETIIPHKTKSMDIQFHWLKCRDAQGQFR